MEFLGFDIYLVIVVIAAVIVGVIMFVMAKTIGRSPKPKKQTLLPAAKTKKLAAAKPRPALKAPASKKNTAPVKPVKRPVAPVPIAGKGKAKAQDEEEEAELQSPDAAPEEKVQTVKAVKAKTPKPVEEKKEFDSMEIPEEPAETADRIVGDAGDQPPVDEMTEPEVPVDQVEPAKNAEQTENDQLQDENSIPDMAPDGAANEMEDPASAASPAGLLDLDKKGSGDEPGKEGGLLDLFEEEDDEDSTAGMLAAKLEDVDSKSLEEIGKEISQSLFSKY